MTCFLTLAMAVDTTLFAICSLGAALATKAWLQEDISRAGVVKVFSTPIKPNWWSVITFRAKRLRGERLTS